MKKNYIVIGDSIIYGIGDFETNGWPSMFKNYIINKDDSKVCNNYVHIAGFPGVTTTDILEKFDSIFATFKHDEFENIVILSIGVNDTQEFNGNYKTSIDKYKENMEGIIRKASECNCKLIIAGLTRIEAGEKFYWKPNKYYDNKVITEYDETLRLIVNYDAELKVICDKRNIKYIPMDKVLERTDYIDGLHPTREGHRKIFNEVVKNIEEV